MGKRRDAVVRGLLFGGFAVAAAAVALLVLPSPDPGAPSPPEPGPAVARALPESTPTEGEAAAPSRAPSTPAAVGAAAAPTPGTGSLVVRVLESEAEDAATVAGADVVVATMPAFARGPYVPPRRAWTVRTGPDGLARLPVLVAGDYGVTASASTTGPRSVGCMTEVVASRETLLELRLEPVSRRLTVLGRVVASEGGRPVPRARVSVGSRASLRTVTDEDGVFRLENLSARWVLRVAAVGFAPAFAPLDGKKDGDGLFRVEVRLEPGGSVAGFVRDEAGRPVEGAVVRARGKGENGLRDVEEEARTGTDGGYRIDSLPLDAVYSIEACGEDRFASAQAETVLSKETPEGRADLVVKLLGRLRVQWSVPGGTKETASGGSVRADEEDAPGPRASPPVAWLRPRGDTGCTRFERGDGSAEFKGIEPGRYEVIVLGDEGIARTEVDLKEGDNPDVSLTLSPAPVIEGRVETTSGRPPGERLELTAFLQETGTGRQAGWRSTVRTSKDGSFRFLGVVAGREYEIRADWIGQRMVVKAPAAGVRYVMLATGSLTGRVVAPVGERLPRDVWISWEAWEEEGGWQLRMSQGGDWKNGRFGFEGVMPGRTRVRASASGFLAASKEVEVTADAAIDIGDLALGVGATISGRVLDPAGRGVAGAGVSAAGVVAEGVSYDGQERSGAITDAGGRFTLRGFGGGAVVLSVRAEGFVDGTSGEVRPGGGPVEVVLSPTFRLSGRVRRADGAPLAGVAVSAFCPGVEEVVTTEGVDFQGRYEIRLAPGKYHIVIHVAGQPHFFGPVHEVTAGSVEALAEADVTIEEGKEATLDLQAPP